MENEHPLLVPLFFLCLGDFKCNENFRMVSEAGQKITGRDRGDQ